MNKQTNEKTLIEITNQTRVSLKPESLTRSQMPVVDSVKCRQYVLLFLLLT